MDKETINNIADIIGTALACAFLGISESAFYSLRKTRKDFPLGIKFSDRNTVFSSEELATWAENQRNANLDKEDEQC